MDERTLARFMAKVEKQDAVTSPHVDTPCWLWTAHTARGYGQLWNEGHVVRVHRLAHEHWIGPLGKLHCCHRCDTPSCVNPGHLFAGTPAENAADRDAKGRKARGARQGMAKLTRDDVLAIRVLLAAGGLQRSIAAGFGVSETTISRIKLGKAWGWL